MNQTLKKISFENVENTLKEALGLEDSVQITPDTKIAELYAEPIDILDIYFRLGMNFSEYASGEKINEKGRRILYRIAEINRRRRDYNKMMHFNELAKSQTTNEYINKLVAGDFVDIKNYG